MNQSSANRTLSATNQLSRVPGSQDLTSILKWTTQHWKVDKKEQDWATKAEGRSFLSRYHPSIRRNLNRLLYYRRGGWKWADIPFALAYIVAIYGWASPLGIYRIARSAGLGEFVTGTRAARRVNSFRLEFGLTPEYFDGVPLADLWINTVNKGMIKAAIKRGSLIVYSTSYPSSPAIGQLSHCASDKLVGGWVWRVHLVDYAQRMFSNNPNPVSPLRRSPFLLRRGFYLQKYMTEGISHLIDWEQVAKHGFKIPPTVSSID